MSTLTIQSRLGGHVNYDILQDGALRYRVACGNTLGHDFSLQDVACGNVCALTAQHAMSSKAHIASGAGQPVTIVDTGMSATKLSFLYGGRSYRWKQKTLAMSWTFKLTDETSGKEIAVLKAHMGLSGISDSSIHLHEGQWDPAWVQLVVLTSLLAIKTGQLTQFAATGI